MTIISTFLVAVVAVEHLYILVLEMFLWTSPRSLDAFGTTLELAEQTTAIAANQGLYNGFLAAGLIWGLVHPNARFGFQLKLFFLLCVIAAATFGALSVKPSIFIVQGVPALLALASLFLANATGRRSQ